MWLQCPLVGFKGLNQVVSSWHNTTKPTVKCPHCPTMLLARRVGSDSTGLWQHEPLWGPALPFTTDHTACRAVCLSVAACIYTTTRKGIIEGHSAKCFFTFMNKQVGLCHTLHQADSADRLFIKVCYQSTRSMHSWEAADRLQGLSAFPHRNAHKSGFRIGWW